MMGKPAGGSNSASRFSFCMMFWRCDSCKKSALTNPEKWDKLKRMQRRGRFFMQTFTNNLIFSLNATIPIFLMMALGFFLQRIHLLDDHTTQKLNQFAFKVLLPALLFMDLSTADFQSVWDTKFVLFCFCI